MAINKVVYDGTTLIDLSSDTLSSADQLAQGVVAHDRTGAVITGTGTSGTPAIAVTEEPDTGGGVIKNITALDISDTTAVAEDVAQGKYFYTAGGVKTVGTASAGGGGLEYEEGTWTPSEDVTSAWISFTNTHTTAPFYYMIADVGAYDSTTSTNYGVTYYNWEQALGASMDEDGTGYYCYGRVFFMSRASSTALGGSNTPIRYPISNTGSSGTGYPRYWATDTGIYAYTNYSNRYWRAGRTYKWIAVWAPTT